jgi:hypothetical protein
VSWHPAGACVPVPALQTAESEPEYRAPVAADLGITARGTLEGFERASSADRLVPPAVPGTIALG